MLPTHLEKLILKGKAEFNTFNCAFGQYFALPIPAKATIIITGIEWSQFINPIGRPGETSVWEWLKSNEYQLRITDYSREYFLNYRNSLLLSLMSPGIGDSLQNTTIEQLFEVATVSAANKIFTPMYAMLQGQQAAFVVTKNRTAEAVLGVGAGLLSDSQEPVGPAGVKGFGDVLLSAAAGPTLDYIPPTPRNSPAAPTLTGSYSNQYYNGVSDDSILNIANLGELGNRFKTLFLPLFTVHYVLIKENLIDLID